MTDKVTEWLNQLDEYTERTISTYAKYGAEPIARDLTIRRLVAFAREVHKLCNYPDHHSETCVYGWWDGTAQPGDCDCYLAEFVEALHRLTEEET